MGETSYACTPVRSNYLMPSAGKFATENSIVTFRDTAIHPATSGSGDWLLNGEYAFYVNGTSLTLIQNNEVAKWLIKFDFIRKE
jgi:hypothetical protein